MWCLFYKLKAKNFRLVRLPTGDRRSIEVATDVFEQHLLFVTKVGVRISDAFPLGVLPNPSEPSEVDRETKLE